MKSLLGSGFTAVALILLLGLSVFNTCQIENLERRLVGLNPVRPDAPRSVPGTERRANFVDEDPSNLLKRRTRPLNDDLNARRGGHLRLQTGQDPQGFNPYVANGADAAEFVRYINNMLCQRDVKEPGRFTPDLATKITTSDKGRTFDVSLRSQVFWHPPALDLRDPRYRWLDRPHELTSDDFAFVFDMIDNPRVTGRVAALRNYFDGAEVEVLDRYRFRVRFKERAYTNLPNLCSLHPSPRWLMMFDRDGVRFDEASWGIRVSEHWYNHKGIGTGPYRFVDWEPGSRIRFEKNPDYFGEPAAFDRITVRVVKDQNAWTRLLKTGELDLTVIRPEQFRTEVLNQTGPLLGHSGIKQMRREELGYFYVGWNADSPYFDRKEARQSMTLALDREGVLKNVFHGLGRVTDGPFPQQNPCYDHQIEGWPYDLSEARRKLALAGWEDLDGDGIREKEVNGERIPFSFELLIYGSSTEYAALANIYKEALLKIGVRLTPRPLEWSTLLKRIADRDFVAYTAAWVVDWEVDLFQLWHSTEADRPDSSNRIGFRSEEADGIIEALRRSFDERERVRLCHEFHALVHELQPYTFLYQRQRPILYWDHLNEPEFHQVFPFRDPRLLSFRPQPVP